MKLVMEEDGVVDDAVVREEREYPAVVSATLLALLDMSH